MITKDQHQIAYVCYHGYRHTCFAFSRIFSYHGHIIIRNIFLVCLINFLLYSWVSWRKLKDGEIDNCTRPVFDYTQDKNSTRTVFFRFLEHTFGVKCTKNKIPKLSWKMKWNIFLSLKFLFRDSRRYLFVNNVLYSPLLGLLNSAKVECTNGNELVTYVYIWSVCVCLDTAWVPKKIKTTYAKKAK